jgi:hypothetical protein
VGGGEVDCCAAATAAAIRRPCDCRSRSRRSSLELHNLISLENSAAMRIFPTSVDILACLLGRKAGVDGAGIQGITSHATCCCSSGTVVDRNAQTLAPQCPSSVNYQLSLLSTPRR